VNKNNARHAVLFEAITLILHISVDSDSALVASCASLLAKFIQVPEPNIRYLGLENMARLAALPEMLPQVQQHQSKVVMALLDPDISIRRRGLDLLFAMCDESNVVEIVRQLLDYLATQADVASMEDLVLKTAVLTERFASDRVWYVDAMLELIEKGGEFVGDDIWFRVVQVITNEPSLQAYCAQKICKGLQMGGLLAEPMLKAATYIVGEFGHTVTEIPGGTQLALLHQHFPSASTPTQALLLSAYIKLALRAPHSSPDLQSQIRTEECIFPRPMWTRSSSSAPWSTFL